MEHAAYIVTNEGLLHMSWRLGDDAQLLLAANLWNDSAEPPAAVLTETLLHNTHPHVADEAAKPGWFVAWYLARLEAAL